MIVIIEINNRTNHIKKEKKQNNKKNNYCYA